MSINEFAYTCSQVETSGNLVEEVFQAWQAEKNCINEPSPLAKKYLLEAIAFALKVKSERNHQGVLIGSELLAEIEKLKAHNAITNTLCRQGADRIGELRLERDTLKEQLTAAQGEVEKLKDDLAFERDMNATLTIQLEAARQQIEDLKELRISNQDEIVKHMRLVDALKHAARRLLSSKINACSHWHEDIDLTYGMLARKEINDLEALVYKT